MKKVNLGILLVFGFLAAAPKTYCHDLDEEVNLRVGIDLKKQLKVSSEERVQEANKGLSLGIEELVPAYDGFRFGLGLECSIFPVNINNQAISAIATYATVKVKPFMDTYKKTLQKTYLKGNLGYSKALMVFADMFNGGGLYYAIGIGYETSKGIFYEFNYSRYNNSSKVYGSSDSIDTSFAKIALDVGYKFYY
jgi:hypothetical protein